MPNVSSLQDKIWIFFSNSGRHQLSSRKIIIRWLLITVLAFCMSVLFYLFLHSSPASWSSPELKPLIISNESRTHSVNHADRELLKSFVQPCAGKKPIRSKIRNLVWHIMLGYDRNSEIAIFSAHLDDRINLEKFPVLRLLGISTTSKDVPVYCQLWYKDETEAVITQAKVEDTGRGISNRGQFYQESLYTCPLPEELKAIPESVSLVFQQCDRPTSSVLVNIAEKPTKVKDLGICVAVAYGYVQPHQLVEWVELNRILGVSEMNVYQSRVHVDSMKVFLHYQNISVVNLLTSGPPVSDWCHWCQKLSTIAVINDCMYRNMYRYKHMMVIDFDEFIIPTKASHPYLQDVIEELEKSKGSPQPGYIIKNAYFFLEFPPEEKEDPNLTTMRFQTRISPSEHGYAPKSIVDPRRCIIMQNHYCMIRTPEVGAMWTIAVHEDSLLLHHYKKCHLGEEICKETMESHFKDNTTLRYKEELSKNVQRAYSFLGL